MTARDGAAAEEWRRAKDISIEGRGVPKPVLTFEEASMPDYVLSEVNKQGFKEPSPIQAQGWPMALLGRDMIGISRTGSGKTLAFLLPGMIHINAQPRGACVRGTARGRASAASQVPPARRRAHRARPRADARARRPD